jgi:hypothetical protein
MTLRAYTHEIGTVFNAKIHKGFPFGCELAEV